MLLNCPLCEYRSNSARKFGNHLRAVHKPEYSNQLLYEIIKKALPLDKKGDRNRLRISIYSKKAVRVEEHRTCSSCNIHYSSFWKYKESVIGEVYICYDCKNYFDKSNPRVKTIYTAFETNRRKH